MPNKIFQNYKYDLSLTEGTGARTLPVLIGLMVFMITLCLATGLMISKTSQQWQHSLSNTLTVEISAQSDQDGNTQNIAKDVALFLEKNPSVLSATPLSNDDMMTLIEPWLGDTSSNLSGLNLPVLIDVRLSPDNRLDTQVLAQQLNDRFSGVRLDNHQDWQNNMHNIASIVEIGVLSLTLIMIALSAATIIGSIKSNMSIHRDEIALLHLMGAYDKYITRQFQSHTLHSTLKGAAFGTLSALILFVIVAQFILHIRIVGHLHITEWGILSVLPIILGGGIALTTTRFVTQKELLNLSRHAA